MFSIIGDADLELIETDLVYVHDIKANEDADIAMISKTDFESCIGGNIDEIRGKNECLAVLKKCQLFSTLSFEKFGQIIEAMETTEYTAGSEIFFQGDPGSTFFILREGKVDFMVNDKRIRTI